jgi:hypothetical protein
MDLMTHHLIFNFMKNYTQIENFSRYFINENGQIWSTYRNRHLTPSEIKWGYLRVNLIDNDGKNKGKLVHRLVAETFLPNPSEKKEVNHKNCDKYDNSLSNLEWCTPGENLLHSYKMNRRSAKGENNTNSKVNVQKVKLFRLLHDTFGWTPSKITNTFKLNRSMLNKIIYYKTWKHVI